MLPSNMSLATMAGAGTSWDVKGVSGHPEYPRTSQDITIRMAVWNKVLDILGYLELSTQS